MMHQSVGPTYKHTHTHIQAHEVKKSSASTKTHKTQNINVCCFTFIRPGPAIFIMLPEINDVAKIVYLSKITECLFILLKLELNFLFMQLQNINNNNLFDINFK